jgi:hypothetical protein
MEASKRQPKTFHLIGSKYSKYFDHDHFMGRDVYSDFWDSKNKKAMNIKPSKEHQNNK